MSGTGVYEQGSVDRRRGRSIAVIREQSGESSNSLTHANVLFHLYRTAVVPFLPDEPLEGVRPPVVIGGHGGSGTRVLPRALRLAGYWMGYWVNRKTEDALATRFFLQRNFERVIGDRFAQQRGLEGAFRCSIRCHRLRMPDPKGPWGWKNPRCMWVIPFLASHYPEMKFIHLVRDGRDVALSANMNLLRKHGALLLGDEHPERDRVRSQLRLWAVGNLAAARDGERLLGPNYLRLSYELLCSEPRETLTRIYDHLEQEATPALLDRAQRLIVPSTSIGGWRKSDYRILHEPDAEIAEALLRFGYLADGPGELGAAASLKGRVYEQRPAA
jgi:hypothetical protein